MVKNQVNGKNTGKFKDILVSYVSTELPCKMTIHIVFRETDGKIISSVQLPVVEQVIFILG